MLESVTNLDKNNYYSMNNFLFWNVLFPKVCLFFSLPMLLISIIMFIIDQLEFGIVFTFLIMLFNGLLISMFYFNLKTNFNKNYKDLGMVYLYNFEEKKVTIILRQYIKERKATIEYTQFKNIYETKTQIIFCLDDSHTYMMDKLMFLTGDYIKVRNILNNYNNFTPLKYFNYDVREKIFTPIKTKEEKKQDALRKSLNTNFKKK